MMDYPAALDAALDVTLGLKEWAVIHADCRELLVALPEASVDAVVTDPPYELGFLGKSWDSAGVSFEPDTWAALLRVAKPGAHLLAFGGTRTFHRIACAIEDAGWEIRDCLSWMYGQGFPKSLDVSKAIDKAAGAEREIIARRSNGITGGTGRHAGVDGSYRFAAEFDLTAPATDAARRWQGWGTALKPAWEPIILARKPLSGGTVAANVLAHGTGAINIDGCRIGSTVETKPRAAHGTGGETQPTGQPPPGRWPANVALDEAAAAMLDEQTGTLGASRFFYTAKASTRERNAGLPDGTKNDHPTVKPIALMRWLVRLVTPPGGIVLDPFTGSGTTGIAARAEGFAFLGVEKDSEGKGYVELARARIRGAEQEAA